MCIDQMSLPTDVLDLILSFLQEAAGSLLHNLSVQSVPFQECGIKTAIRVTDGTNTQTDGRGTTFGKEMNQGGTEIL